MKFRRTVGAALIGVASWVLVGCIDSEANFVVNEDATVNGTMKVSMSKELAQMFGIADKDAFEKQLLDPESGNIPEGQGFTVTEEDGQYKMEITYDKTPLDDEDMKIEVTSDDQLKFTYKSEGMGAGETGVSADDMEGMEGSIKFTLEFPGDITKTVPAELPSSVTVDGNVVRIDSDLTETLDLEMYSNRSGATGGSNEDGEAVGSGSGDSKKGDARGIGSYFPRIGLVIVLIAIIGSAFAVLRNRSKGKKSLD